MRNSDFPDRLIDFLISAISGAMLEAAFRFALEKASPVLSQSYASQPLWVHVVAWVIAFMLALFLVQVVRRLVRRRRSRSDVSEQSKPSALGGEALKGPLQGEAALLRSYLDRVIVNNSTLVFGDPTRETMDSASTSGVLALGQVWTPLRITTYAPTNGSPGIARPILPGEGVQFVDDAVLAERARILLVGDPGTGKSTVTSHLAVGLGEAARTALQFGDAAVASLQDVPIRIVLKDVKPSQSVVFSDVWTGMRELPADLGPEDRAAITSLLERLMRDGRTTILMDGLDEVGEEALTQIKALIATLMSACARTRLLVTCRTYDYSLTFPDRRVPVDMTLRLLPFEPSDMAAYVTNWYEGIVKIGRLPRATSEDLKRKLIRSLEQPGPLREMGRTPLLLTLITLVHTEQGELPESRALVYDKAIRYMLAETAQWRRQSGDATVATDEMMMLAQLVAYRTHCALEEVGETHRGFSRSDLTSIAEEFFRVDAQPLGSPYELAQRKVTAHVSRLVQSNGLLIDQGGGKFAFAHPSFREFLAGQFFGQGSYHLDALRAAARPHWREAFRLLAGYGARASGNLYYLLHLIGDLATTRRDAPLPPAAASDPILAGEMLIEIGRDFLLRAGYPWILGTDQPTADHSGLWFRTCATLVELVGSNPTQLPTPERIRAGRAIGQLGDLRLLDRSGELLPITTRLVPLPAISMSIGSDVGRGSDDERPKRRVDFPAFAVGRFLITNLEFACFIRGGGYDDGQWWKTDEAERWRTGDSGFLAEVKKIWTDTVAEYHAKELRDREIHAEDLANEADRRCNPRREPYYWHDSRFNAPNQPVVGINWWEARAFCAWLTAEGHAKRWLGQDETLRLPTEFEWERTSRDRDDGRLFPWGDEPDQDRAHTREDQLELTQATPVGTYPQGTWPGGPLDLSGNVWEWLESLKLPYSPEFDTGRDSPSSLEERAIKGSSWYNVLERARCGARFVDRPYNLYYDVGFRVVRESAAH